MLSKNGLDTEIPVIDIGSTRQVGDIFVCFRFKILSWYRLKSYSVALFGCGDQ